MPTHEMALSDREKELIEEVRELMGFSSIEETIEFLARERLKEMLAKLAGQEVKQNRHYY